MSALSRSIGSPMRYHASTSGVNGACSSSSISHGDSFPIPSLGNLLYHLWVAALPDQLGHCPVDGKVMNAVTETYPCAVKKLKEVIANVLDVRPESPKQSTASTGNVGAVLLDEYKLLYSFHHFLEEYNLADWDAFFGVFCDEHLGKNTTNVICPTVLEELGDFIALSERQRIIFMYILTTEGAELEDIEIEQKAIITAQVTHMAFYKEASERQYEPLEAKKVSLHNDLMGLYRQRALLMQCQSQESPVLENRITELQNELELHIGQMITFRTTRENTLNELQLEIKRQYAELLGDIIIQDDHEV